MTRNLAQVEHWKMWKGLVALTSLSTETAAAAVVLPLAKEDGERSGGASGIYSFMDSPELLHATSIISSCKREALYVQDKLSWLEGLWVKLTSVFVFFTFAFRLWLLCARRGKRDHPREYFFARIWMQAAIKRYWHKVSGAAFQCKCALGNSESVKEWKAECNQ